jgi:hypothetical protein
MPTPNDSVVIAVKLKAKYTISSGRHVFVLRSTKRLLHVFLSSVITQDKTLCYCTCSSTNITPILQVLTVVMLVVMVAGNKSDKVGVTCSDMVFIRVTIQKTA